MTELAELPDSVADDFEYIELLNSDSSATVSIDGMQLGGDVSVTLGDEELLPGESAVVVANERAFELRYGESVRVVGEYDGSLDDTEPHVQLIDTDTHALVDLTLALSDLLAKSRSGRRVVARVD